MWLSSTREQTPTKTHHSLFAGFLNELRNALPREKKWSQARERLGDLPLSVAPLGALDGVVRMNGSEILKRAAERVRGDVSSTARKKEAEEALAELQNPVLVCLDDMDRLLSHELQAQASHCYDRVTESHETLLAVRPANEIFDETLKNHTRQHNFRSDEQKPRIASFRFGGGRLREFRPPPT